MSSREDVDERAGEWHPMLPMNPRALRWKRLSEDDRREVIDSHPHIDRETLEQMLWEKVPPPRDLRCRFQSGEYRCRLTAQDERHIHVMQRDSRTTLGRDASDTDDEIDSVEALGSAEPPSSRTRDATWWRAKFARAESLLEKIADAVGAPRASDYDWLPARVRERVGP